MSFPDRNNAEAPPVPANAAPTIHVPETAAEAPDPGRAGDDDRWLDWVRRILQGEENAQPVPVPEEVERLVTEELYDKAPSPQERRRLTVALTLQRRHGGEEIACLHTPDGPVVLAVGRRQVGLLLKGIPAERRRSVSVEYPAPW